MTSAVDTKPLKCAHLKPTEMLTSDPAPLDLRIVNTISHTLSDHENSLSKTTRVTFKPSPKGLAMRVRTPGSSNFTEYSIGCQRLGSLFVDNRRNLMPQIEQFKNEAHPTTEGPDQWNSSTDSGIASVSIGSDTDEPEGLLYDIDLQDPVLDLGHPDECPEAEQLTPTLSPACLRDWRVVPDLSPDSRDSGIDTFCYPYDTGVPFTFIKSRTEEFTHSTVRGCKADLTQRVEVESPGDDLDEPEKLSCVSYSDVHMEVDAGEVKVETPDAESRTEREVTAQINAQPLKGTKKKKVKRDEPGALKRPKNGFIRFAMKYRKKVAQDHPRLDNREISRILGIRWRKLSYEEKKIYEIEFQTEMNERKLEHPEWRYGGVRQYVDPSACEPIPSRLRPRHTLKRIKIPKMTRPYTRRGKNAVVSLTWVQCDRCDKWRQLPYGIDSGNMPEKWFCEYNWPPKNHCDAEEDQEDPEEMEFTKKYLDKVKTEEPKYQYSLDDYVTF